MFLSKLLARLDPIVSAILLRSWQTTTPGADGAASSSTFFGLIGPRYVIFRDGKIHSIGGVFEVQHRYDADGRLLSRRLRRHAELREGDAILYGYQTRIQGLHGKRPPMNGMVL